MRIRDGKNSDPDPQHCISTKADITHKSRYPVHPDYLFCSFKSHNWTQKTEFFLSNVLEVDWGGGRVGKDLLEFLQHVGPDLLLLVAALHLHWLQNPATDTAGLTHWAWIGSGTELTRSLKDFVYFLFILYFTPLKILRNRPTKQYRYQYQ